MTYLPAAGQRRLAACFEQTAVYRPSNRPLPEKMAAAVKLGRLAIRIPIEKDSDKLAAYLDATYAWAAQNKGIDLGALKGRDDGVPFFNEASISGIRQNIREIGSQSQPATADPVFEARLFLEMAQELDRQDDELEKSLDNVKIKEDSMLADLMGDAADHRDIPTTFGGVRSTDPGAYLTGRRLKAWWRLAREGTGPGNLLVTDSPAVMDYLVERTPGLEKAGSDLDLPCPPAGEAQSAEWRDQLRTYLEAVAAGSQKDALPQGIPAVQQAEETVRLTVYRQTPADPAALFTRREAAQTAGTGPGGDAGLVLCLVTADGGKR
jgi:hypothetical protein